MGAPPSSKSSSPCGWADTSGRPSPPTTTHHQRMINPHFTPDYERTRSEQHYFSKFAGLAFLCLPILHLASILYLLIFYHQRWIFKMIKTNGQPRAQTCFPYIFIYLSVVNTLHLRKKRSFYAFVNSACLLTCMKVTRRNLWPMKYIQNFDILLKCYVCVDNKVLEFLK